MIASVLFLVLFSFTHHLNPQQEVVMRIREGMPIIPVAVPKIITSDPSQELSSAASIIREVIISDLKYSRVFSPLPEDYYKWIKPLDPENIIFRDWESIQAKLLLSSEMSQNEDGSFLFEAKIYDVKSTRFIKGKKYQSDQELLRLVGHKISNEFMKIYGESPIFTTKIVFISNRDGNDELYMMDYDGHNQIRLTFNKTRDYMPAWSTDGKTIVYTAYNNEKAALYLYNPFEGQRSLITDHGTSFGADFSYNGEKIAFCSTEDESNSEIYVSDSSGKGIKRLTYNNAIDTAPSWSPNNREIAFTSDRLGSPQIYIMDAEGSNVRRRSFGGNYHDAPAWAPTGDRIVYVSRVAAVFDLYVLNLRTDRIIKLTEGYSRNESPSWSPDGRHIIFSSNRTGTIQIYSIDYDGSHMRRLTSQGENKLPNWSRN